MRFDFALNINNDASALSPENGLDIKQLGPLSKSLGLAIADGQNSRCILFQIENHGYTPHFTTQSQNIYQNFLSVHRNIFERGLSDLSTAERAYAKVLKQVLARDQFVQPLDIEDKPVCKIYRASLKDDIPHFSTITNVTGIISEIGSEQLEQASHILLNGLDYRIYISSEQDAQLKSHYKSSLLEFKLKQKRNTRNGQITSARLISFKVKTKLSLFEALASIKADDITFPGNPRDFHELPF